MVNLDLDAEGASSGLRCWTLAGCYGQRYCRLRSLPRGRSARL